VGKAGKREKQKSGVFRDLQPLVGMMEDHSDGMGRDSCAALVQQDP